LSEPERGRVFILDSLLIDGLGFVFDKIRVAADADRDDESRLREVLLDGQMRLESGELSDDAYADLERDVLDRLSAARRRRGGGDTVTDHRVTGVDVQFTGDDEQP
jgi:Gas vesicle protein G